MGGGCGATCWGFGWLGCSERGLKKPLEQKYNRPFFNATSSTKFLDWMRYRLINIVFNWEDSTDGRYSYCSAWQPIFMQSWVHFSDDGYFLMVVTSTCNAQQVAGRRSHQRAPLWFVHFVIFWLKKVYLLWDISGRSVAPLCALKSKVKYDAWLKCSLVGNLRSTLLVAWNS